MPNSAPSDPLELDDCLSFIADTHFEAVRKIQAEVGLDALVVHSRSIPATGLGRLWKKPKVELIVKPRPQEPTKVDDPLPSPAPPPKTVKRQKAALLNVYNQDKETTASPSKPVAQQASSPGIRDAASTSKPMPHHLASSAAERCESILRRIGLDELFIAKICDQAALKFQSSRNTTNRALLDFCRNHLAPICESQSSSYHCEKRPVVLLGAPGCGKTTLIGKWISILSLKTNLASRVWKLDGLRANTDEFLDLITELHQVPLERTADPRFETRDNEILFIDIPGVDWNDPKQMDSLRTDLESLPTSSLYLVLNAAYDSEILKRQIRAYGSFPIAGVILSHLDEEKRWSKILNITLGTNFPLRIVSGGQNIPGYFQAARSEEILSHIFPKNTPFNPET